jgi:hypothetical protein
MVKHTRRRGGAWYDPRTWFSSSSSTEETAPAPTQSDYGMSSTSTSTGQPTSSPYGGRKGGKTRRGRGKRRGTKAGRKH